MWLVLIIPILVIFHFFSLKLGRKKALMFANFEAIEKFSGKKILSKNLVLLILRSLALLLIIFSIVGTIYVYSGKSAQTNFILAIDASGSMLADDYTPNRLEASKKAALEFVDSLPFNTKIGVIDFAGASFIRLKPSSNTNDIKKSIEGITVETVGGTAIGDVLITSVNLLLGEKNTKSIILLTDGQSNVGASIEEAIQYSNDNFVEVNAIAIATKTGGKFSNLNGSIVSQVDEESLKKISSLTNGKYFLAENEETLKNAYSEISNVKKRKVTLDISTYLLMAGLVLLLIEWILLNTKYRTIP